MSQFVFMQGACAAEGDGKIILGVTDWYPGARREELQP
jgi:hypothetical protein